ncbi:peptidase M15 [Achromatium sp. WMS2]|nr:peptidase M15 [Achromatium sp. WMS2]
MFIMKLHGLLLYLLLSTLNNIAADTIPPEFGYAKEVIPNLIEDMRYFSTDNFVGQRIHGYQAPRCILSQPALAALAKLQTQLRAFGLGIKVFDRYRPQQAVNHFVQWAKDLDAMDTKAKYYPGVDKRDLFKLEYISDHSSHSRGSTVDLSLVFINSGSIQDVDMGTQFDFFGPQSWPDSKAVSPQQRANRLLLRSLMLAHGFIPYPQEWWHFTLEREPFPDQYFDFTVH